MPAPLYTTDKEPCIPVLFLDGRQEYLGWRDVLLRAHTIEDLALPVPPAASAALRVLVALTARVTELDDPTMRAGEWAAQRRLLLKQPDGFDPDRVHAYFDRYIWDLYDPVHPFLQDPRLPEQCDNRAGVNKLVFGRPEGNNLAWLSPHTDTDPQPVPSEQALWHLLIHHYYGASGQCSARTTTAGRQSGAKAGPLRSAVSFHPLGRTLYETLLAGLPKPADPWPDADDRCPWEEPLPDPDAAPPPVTSPGRLLTGRSRHALLLVPSPDGRHATDAYVTWATQTSLPAEDPYLIYRVDPSKPPATAYKARTADADRALWRDLDALLLAGDEGATRDEPYIQRPAAFTTLNDLPPELRTSLRVRVHGFDQDPKTTNRTWYTALTPPIWPWTQEHDDAAAERFAACRKAAEKIGTLLEEVSKEAWRKTISPDRDGRERPKQTRRLPAWTRQARTAYWPRAETTFWRLLDDPSRNPTTAFAADAITALHTASAAAIAQYFDAAPAIADAVNRLRRAR
ncbi:type I-E CRISPR-associated protein Cse1/CasA [Streptomyces europaeiscabiei]|uniref:type I-E CRISPR-associated protein Cse1/CasA n=1 Tax=Streptomyces europaeiscabiei TaxID=146819 RepID=UPI000B2D3D0F|nr:type I-E CRISPR-associated protein Cse1/CasA [Streptomyces europaeiscabiei]